MKAETFLKNFGHLADAPDGIAALRKMVVQLAMRGRLTSQNPEDEPASVLLARIRRETKESAPSRLKGLPSGWVATNVGVVFEFAYGKSLPQKNRISEGTVPVFGSNGVVGTHDEALVSAPSL